MQRRGTAAVGLKRVAADCRIDLKSVPRWTPVTSGNVIVLASIKTILQLNLKHPQLENFYEHLVR
jgi:hypothetical protein